MTLLSPSYILDGPFSSFYPENTCFWTIMCFVAPLSISHSLLGPGFTGDASATSGMSDSSSFVIICYWSNATCDCLFFLLTGQNRAM